MSGASDRRKGGGDDGPGEGANWMDTYGDLVTLLLCFFVLLFSFSTIDADKWKALVGSFTGQSIVAVSPMTADYIFESPIEYAGAKSNTEYTPDSNETDPFDPSSADNIREADETLRELYDKMKAYTETNNIAADIVISEDEYIVIMTISDQVFFRSGDASLLTESITVLEHVAEMFFQLDDLYTKLSIVGNTDSRPISTSKYPSNWELSLDRAMSVQKYLINTGKIEPQRTTVGGNGEYDPVADNDTPEGMAKNRRVDFIAETERPKIKSGS